MLLLKRCVVFFLLRAKAISRTVHLSHCQMGDKRRLQNPRGNFHVVGGYWHTISMNGEGVENNEKRSSCVQTWATLLWLRLQQKMFHPGWVCHCFPSKTPRTGQNIQCFSVSVALRFNPTSITFLQPLGNSNILFFFPHCSHLGGYLKNSFPMINIEAVCSLTWQAFVLASYITLLLIDLTTCLKCMYL